MAAGSPDKLGPDLSAYLDGELPEQRARRIERLLSEHPELREHLEQLRAVSDQLAHLPRRGAPDELTSAMRRHAERRQLLDEAQAAGGGRVLKLFVRLTATAAVVAACVFVGYQVIDRDAPQPEIELADRHQTDAQPPGAPAVAARRLSKADSSRLEPAESPLIVAAAPPLKKSGALADEDNATLESPRYALALTDRVTSAPAVALGGIPADAVSGLASLTKADPAKPLEIAFADEAMLGRPESTLVLDAPGTPLVDVRITPGDTQQYADARAVLANSEWVRVTSWDAHGATDAGAEGDSASAQAPIQVVRQVAAGEVARLIVELEQRAPERVQCDFKGVGGDLLQEVGRTLVERSGEETDDAASNELFVITLPKSKPLAERSAARQRIAGVRGPGKHADADRALGEQAREGVEEKDKKELRAARRKDHAPASRGSRDRMSARGRGSNVSEGTRRAGGRGGAPEDELSAPERRERELEFMGLPMSAEAEINAQRKEPPADRRPAPISRGRSVVRGIVESLKYFARSLPPPRERITVRVTLLPPPAAKSATQPASQPASP